MSLENSYYKFSDGTILSLSALLSHAKIEPNTPQGFTIQTTTRYDVFSPLILRGPATPLVLNQVIADNDIVDNDMDFEVLREPFSVFEISNGYEIKLRCIISQITKTRLFAPTGEPIYNVNHNIISKMNKIK